MDKEDVGCVCVCVCTHTTHTHRDTHTTEYYSAVKKNELLPFAATWMDLEIIILNEVSQTEKDKYYKDITYMWNLKMIKMNLFTKQTVSKTQKTNLRIPKGKEGG